MYAIIELQMLGFLFSDPALFLVWAGALVSAVTVHEFAHAWMAVRLGDPTPKLQGRLTLNPLAHLDPLGTLMLLLIRFGWGRPVQFDPFNLENPRRDSAIISLAGPASNLLLASLLSLLLRISQMPFSSVSMLSQFIPPFIILNVVLAIFNLIPVHPLDGGKILVGLLPPAEAARVDSFMKRYGIFLLIILIFPIFGSSPVFAILSPIINFLLGIYIPGASAI
jgi:Zn-dependent protease